MKLELGGAVDDELSNAALTAAVAAAGASPSTRTRDADARGDRVRVGVRERGHGCSSRPQRPYEDEECSLGAPVHGLISVART